VLLDAEPGEQLYSEYEVGGAHELALPELIASAFTLAARLTRA
jgi:hypothetical protein